MQIIINIDENVFTRLFDDIDCHEIDDDELDNLFITATAVRNGIVLPEGHGRIIDESQITSVEYHEEIETIKNLFEIAHIIIDSTNAPTIVEADMGEIE